VRPSEIQNLAIGALQGLGATSLFLLVLFIGFCVVLGFLKLRRTDRSTVVHRSLDELVGPPMTYLGPDAPRGPVDQLRTPELLEAKGREE
jgi:hypothetical protein